jgi:hypothetical protein
VEINWTKAGDATSGDVIAPPACRAAYDVPTAAAARRCAERAAVAPPPLLTLPVEWPDGTTGDPSVLSGDLVALWLIVACPRRLLAFATGAASSTVDAALAALYCV